ncbi:hypothetical protein [Yersinia phage vB_YenM_P778]
MVSLVKFTGEYRGVRTLERVTRHCSEHFQMNHHSDIKW